MLNSVNIQGRLVHTPDLRQTTQGNNVTSFRVAIDRDFVNKDGVRESDFVDIIAWRGLAEFVTRNFIQGDTVVITGRIQSHRYEAPDGTVRNVQEIVADDVYFPGFRAQRTEDEVETLEV